MTAWGAVVARKPMPNGCLTMKTMTPCRLTSDSIGT